MPKKDNVGYSECTKFKMEHFSRIIAMHLAVTQAVLLKNKQLYPQNYRYIELTAGKGYSPNGEKGSPIIFLEQAESEKFTLPYRADFIECETKNINELKSTLSKEKIRNIWKENDLFFHNDKYEIIIPSLLSNKSYKEFGLVFVDPSGDLPDFDCLKYIAEMRPKMEILIYIASTNVKRVFQYTEKRLIDFIEIIGKRNWLIRKPISWDQFKWTFLLGSNAPIFNNYKKIEFYRLESKDGQRILEKLNLTEKEQIESKQYKMF